MIRVLSRLFRVRLAFLNGIAALGGGLLFPVRPGNQVLWAVFAGVTLLAGAGSALNQVLERDLDLLMRRTRRRPLPSGELTVPAAVTIAVVTGGAGCALLTVFGGALPAVLGIAALGWYLAVYTPLKRRTSCALIPGALCGAVPPVIGWCAAGGLPFDYRVVVPAGLMFLWQALHFWLLQRRHMDDYRRAGFPLLPMGREGTKPSGLFLLWSAALLSGTLLLPVFGLISPRAVHWYPIFPLSLALLILIRSERALFAYLNLFPLLMSLAFIA